MNDDKLKPCPSCGGEPAFGHIHYAKSHEAWWQDGSQIRDAAFVSCVSCGISNQGMFGHQTEADAATAWNTRAPVRVKPLEWEAEDGRETCLDADGCGKLYRVLVRHDGSAALRHNASAHQQTEHDSEESAKAAAQTDYEARILSAIAPGLCPVTLEAAAQALSRMTLDDAEPLPDDKLGVWCVTIDAGTNLIRKLGKVE